MRFKAAFWRFVPKNLICFAVNLLPTFLRARAGFPLLAYIGAALALLPLLSAWRAGKSSSSVRQAA